MDWVRIDTFGMTALPHWFAWPIEISPHAARRMPTRGFSEIDLRGMLEQPESLIPDACPGRFLAHCRWQGRRWDVVREPDETSSTIIVVTAYAPTTP